MIGAIFPGASNGGVLAGTAIIAAHAIDACRTLVALHLRQRLLEVLTLDNSFHRRSCDRRAFETGFRRTRFDRSGNDARGFLLPHGSREIAALLPSSTLRAFGGAPPPTMPSADFCATIRSPCDDPSPEGHGADLPR